MKKIISLQVMLLFLLLHVTKISHAQTKSTIKEFIVQVPGIYEKRGLPEIRAALESVNGVQYVGFCKTQQLIYCHYDAQIINDEKIILNALIATQYKFYVKRDASIEKVIQNCKDLP